MKLLRLAVGIGCDRGVSVETLESALTEALSLCAQSKAQIESLASIELKRDEKALQEFANKNGWKIKFYPATELAQVNVPNPSETVRRYTGTPAVAEAAVLLAVNSGLENLIIEKYKYLGKDGKNATVSIARFD